jgi:hypothetical protein
MDGRVETSKMETVPDADQKVEGEEKKTASVTSEKATPPATKASASPEKPKAAAKPAVGSSAGAKGKTVESAAPDPVNKMRRTIIWTAVGGFLATCFMMFLRFFLPRTIFEPSTIFESATRPISVLESIQNFNSSTASGLFEMPKGFS